MAIAHPDLPRLCILQAQLGGAYPLHPDDAKHLKVLRLVTGDLVHVTDGKGKLFEARLLIEKRQTTATITYLCEDQSEEKRHQIAIAIAPTKNTGRLEWFIEKAAEIGVDRIITMTSEHSERIHLKTDRLHRIAISALKQSKSLFLMEIDEVKPFSDVLELEGFTEKLIAHCKIDNAKTKLSNFCALPLSGNIVVAIGPEGDFSEKEITAASKAGWLPLDLGAKRLRTETAALTVAIASTILRS